MSCQVKHWIYINEVDPVKYVKTKEMKEMKEKEKEKKVHWFRWFFIKIEKPVEVWEDAFPWP